MSDAVYNEIEPYCVQWLENLIAAGHIAPGRVERELRRLTAKSERAAEARRALPAGSSRARVTTANARWMRAAEARDRVAAQLAALETA